MIDLHLHLDGALSLDSVRELADMQHIAVPEDDAELLRLMRVGPDCRNLDEFLEKFAFPCSLLQTKAGLTRAVSTLCAELKSQGLVYAEIRFAPAKSCEKGMSQEDAVLAALDGLREAGALYCPDVPAAECSDVPAAECSGVPAVECSGIPAAECSGVPAAECSNVPAAECSGIPAAECSGAGQCPTVETAAAGKSFAANLILCCMRGASELENTETVRLAHKYLGQGVCAADLAGAEALFPNGDYAEVFALARRLGVPFEIHAGEADGPSSVWSALELGAARIGHGVRGAEDPLLLKQLSDNQVPLMLCPTSNVQTCVFADVADMPVRALMDAGVKITINTDDPSIEGTDLRSEWKKIINAFRLTPGEVEGIMLNCVDASFASAELKAALRSKVSAGFRDFLG